MKKNTLKRAMSAAAVSALALSVSSVSAFAAISDKSTPYAINPTDGSSAASKPVVDVTKVVYDTPAEAAGKTVTVTIAIKGDNVDGKYCTTGFHVYWDDRLTVVPNRAGLYANALSGDSSAAGALGTEQQANGANGVFLCSMGSADNGYTGDMWTINLQVPAGAKAGDVYPIDIAYDSAGSGKRADLFTNNADDAQGKLMQAYFFTQGTNSSANPSTDPYLVNAPKTDSTFTSAPTFADGYIAIKAAATTTTTITTTAPVTSATPTTSSTAAPATSATAAPTTSSTVASSSTATQSAAGTAATTGSNNSTTAATTTAKSGGTNKQSDSPKTGVTGVGVAAAGLAVAIGTAFALKKKED
jgi:hypothetical protein